jgi:hypothetical protein
MGLRHLVLTASFAVAGVGVAAGTASAARTKAGIEAFALTQSFTSEGGSVTASGVIDATGTDIVVSPSEDLFDFGAAGTITVLHSPIASATHFNEHSCTVRIHETGRYTFGNGTGAFAAYSGSGTYRVTGTGTDACSTTGPVGTISISAKGPIVPLGG